MKKLNIFSKLNALISKLNLIMATFQDVEDKIVTLKESVDALQAKVSLTISTLQASIDAGTGLSSADAEKLIADIQAVQDVVDNTPLSTVAPAV